MMPFQIFTNATRLKVSTNSIFQIKNYTSIVLLKDKMNFALWAETLV